MSQPSDVIARRLCEVRQGLGWTMTYAAAEADVSVAHLSRIEKGTRQPSIGMLLQLAHAYHLSLGQLVGEEPHATSHISRYREVRTHEGPDGSYGTLSGIIGNHLLEALRLNVAPHAATSESSQHDGEEWLFVLDGSVRFVQGDTAADLALYDSVHLDARAPHHLQNVTDQPATVLLITAGSQRTRTNGHTAPVALTNMERAPQARPTP